MTTPEPGWYPDPDSAERDRYWDGESWTAITRATPTRIGSRSRRTVGLIIAAAIFLAATSIALWRVRSGGDDEPKIAATQSSVEGDSPTTPQPPTAGDSGADLNDAPTRVASPLNTVDWANLYMPVAVLGAPPGQFIGGAHETNGFDDDTGSLDAVYIGAEDVKYGDLDGDGTEEAVVGFSFEAGASGYGSTAFVFAAGPTVVGEVPKPPLEPGVDYYNGVSAFAIRDGVLEVVWYGYAPGDVRADPSIEVTKRYDIDDGGVIRPID
jgi:hypothetical protein